jgi:hypothetical protein
VLLRLQEKQQRSELPRRMPCEKNTQAAGTLIPKESRTLPLQSTYQRCILAKTFKNNNPLKVNL